MLIQSYFCSKSLVIPWQEMYQLKNPKGPLDGKYDMKLKYTNKLIDLVQTILFNVEKGIK